MKVLVIGSGGREHALVWKLSQSPLAPKLYAAPGNAGMESLAEIVPLKQTERRKLLDFVLKEKIDLTVVGPEQPLIDGIVEEFESAGARIFGPSKNAALLEGSKVFAKQFMKKYGIPTADFVVFEESSYSEAKQYLLRRQYPVVVKADGLAAGKGVTVCDSKEQALEAVELSMERKVLGDAGSRVVIEECLEGEELSLLALTDGSEFILLPQAQDHKRIFDGDRGKNTGGMGAYAPAHVVPAATIEKVKRSVIRPTLQGMTKENRRYRGCLYVGLMMTAQGPMVLEYNCRFGDPETQALLPLLKTDLLDLMLQVSAGKLTTTKPVWNDATAVCVVVSSGGYPDSYETGKKIYGLDSVAAEKDVSIFHAGTRREKKDILTAGGRVLGVTAVGGKDDLEGTIEKAYRSVEKITFDGAYYRSDIGKKGLERMQEFLRREA